MKRYLLSIILICFLVITSVIGLLSVKGLAQTDLNYTFQNDNIYNSTNPVYDDSFNIRDTSFYEMGLYNATYSFTDEIGLIGTDISFINTDDSAVDCIASIIDNWNGHNEVLQLFDDNNAGRIDVYSNFGDKQLDSTIELWFGVSTFVGNNYFNLIFYEDSDIILQAKLENGNFQYYDGGWNIINSDGVINTWYHFKFIFDDTADTFDWYINGILEGNDNPYLFSTTDGFNKIRIVTNLGDNNFNGYIDAIGYSWDVNYTVDDNFFPYVNTSSNAIEIDRWEFSYSDFPTQYAIGSDIFSDWTEDDTGDYINIAKDYSALDGMPLYYPDRKIKIHDHIGSGANIGIERDFNILDGIINVSWSLNFTALDALSQSEITMEIYSSDDTLLFQIYLEFGDIAYKDGGEVLLEVGIITTGEIYDFNLYYNPHDDINILRFDIDGVHYDSYFIPSLDSSKKGLGKIKFKNYYDPPRELIVYLDNIGVYSNGTSLSTEPAFRQISLDDMLFHKNWDFKPYPLLTLNLSGSIAIHLTDWYFYLELTSIEELIPLTQFEGVDKRFNLYDKTYDGNDYIFTPKLWLEFYNTLEANSISIDGVQLIQGSKEYSLIYSHSNIDVDESYFYVDSSNRLRGQCFYDDSNLEYIQANFDIDDVLNENRSLRFRSSFSGQYGFFSLGYIDGTSTSISLPISERGHNLLLSQAKTIEDFVFLITDDDELSAGYGSGFIYNIELIWNPSISITLITISLIMVVIPIIIMIVPTLALYSRYGKSVIMPVFIFMSIICFAGGLIPAWLFFILMVGAGGFLVLKKGSDE